MGSRAPFHYRMPSQSLKCTRWMTCSSRYLPTWSYGEEPTADAQTWFVPFSSFMAGSGRLYLLRHTYHFKPSCLEGSAIL